MSDIVGMERGIFLLLRRQQNPSNRVIENEQKIFYFQWNHCFTVLAIVQSTVHVLTCWLLMGCSFCIIIWQKVLNGGKARKKDTMGWAYKPTPAMRALREARLNGIISQGNQCNLNHREIPPEQEDREFQIVLCPHKYIKSVCFLR